LHHRLTAFLIALANGEDKDGATVQGEGVIGGDEMREGGGRAVSLTAVVMAVLHVWRCRRQHQLVIIIADFAWGTSKQLVMNIS
jgi:hypothetical protein